MFRPLSYHCNEAEHKQYIDRINANPTNCKRCGRLIPNESAYIRAFRHMCNECLDHTECEEQNFKPNFPYNYEESIARQKREMPEWFQKV